MLISSSLCPLRQQMRFDLNELKKTYNKASKAIGLKKRAKEDATVEIAAQKAVKEQVAELEEKLNVKHAVVKQKLAS